MTLPFVMPSNDVFFASPRRVFSHYFPSFPLSIDNKPAASDYYNTQFLNPSGEGGKYAAVGGYVRGRPWPVPVQATFSAIVNMEIEVKMAIARGITGFCVDILSPTDGHLNNMLAAAQAVDDRFSVIPMLDMTSGAMATLTMAQLAAFIETFTHPAFFREDDGRLVVAAFDPTEPLGFWQGVISLLNAQGVDVAFLPVMLGSATASALSPISIGTGAWGTATPQGMSAPTGYMAPVSSQDSRPKDGKFWEASNFDTIRAGWVSAIAGAGLGATQLVQLVTWNDFSEGDQIQPFTDATLALNIGTGFYDLTGYYATWFATGVAPKITKDVLYWCYRRMPFNAAHLNQPASFVAVGPAAQNNVELLGFLTEPGVLLIDGQTMSAPAGITSFKVPTIPGYPEFALQRNGSNVQQGIGPVQIYGPEGSPSQTEDETYWAGNI